MLHRNNKDMEELKKSLKIITEENNVIIVGDFNCPDIQWETLSLKHEASDKEVQRTLIEITSQSGFTHLHDEPKRENNLLDLIFTTNPILAKTSTNIPGISDHAIVVTDIDTKPYYQKANLRKSYI
jgi:endonuclease/exonuclease/phosphatase family metal-dependent hydrolase